MKANEYKLLVRCIEDGVQYGWNRAHKHTDEPDEELIKQQIEQAVINEICEWFEFPDLYSEEQ
jgi:hypothetical protein